MTTHIQSLPLITSTVEIGTNEDWRDAWVFVGSGSAVAYPQSTNIGNGTVGAITVAVGAPIGDSVLEILSVGASSVFGVTGPNGDVIGIGTVGVPFNAGGFSFTLTQGGVAFVVGDTFTIATLGAALDITGISFTLAVKATADATRTLLTASTANGLLINDGTNGALNTAIPQATIKQKLRPASYTFDVLAQADSIQRRTITGTLNVVNGIAFSS